MWLVLFFTTWQVARFATGILWRDTLEKYAPHPGPIYIGISGAVWGLAGIFLLWSIARGERWTRYALLIASGLYAAWIWVDRLFVQAQMRSNWPFALSMTIILLAFTIAVVLNPRYRIYFEREAYERGSQNSTSP
jgi:hypothetical protein